MTSMWTEERRAPPDLSDLAKLLPDEKPPIPAIAQMPFPLSMLAMRRFYNADWHKPEPDGETPDKWRVYVSYKYTETEAWGVDVEALTEEEAKEKAEKAFNDAHRWQDVDVCDVEAEFIGTEH